MNKTVLKVFGVIAILVGIFIFWQLTFNNGGILRTAYNSLANGVNGQWAKVAGTGQQILVPWGDDKAATNGTGFEINTKQGGN